MKTTRFIVPSTIIISHLYLLFLFSDDITITIIKYIISPVSILSFKYKMIWYHVEKNRPPKSLL